MALQTCRIALARIVPTLAGRPMQRMCSSANRASTTDREAQPKAGGGDKGVGRKQQMHPKVRDLWKRVIVIGREYPGGLDDFRRKAKAMFRENAHLTSEEDILKAVARGRWYLNNEIIGVIKLKKYREMKKRYGSSTS